MLPIFLINLFAGFTVIGWVYAFVWAVWSSKQQRAIQARANKTA